MSKIHTLFISVLVILVSSCVSKSDIENLQGQINELKTGKIATIEQQITSIQASITGLQATDTQLSAFVSTLHLETSNIKAALSAKEKALSDRIDELKKYTDDELGKTKDWVSATFATLEQYQAVLNDFAEIKESIKTIDTTLRKEIEDSIKSSEESMKGWVNEQLAGYYTIAKMDAKLKALTDADAANEQTIGKVASDLESAKTELTEAYTKAITDAITKYNGDITSQIAEDIKTATDNLQKQIDALDERVSALEGMIQSVVIIPDYSDGSVKATGNGKLTLNCIVCPVAATKSLTVNDITLLSSLVVTKSNPYSEFNATSITVNNNILTISADLSSQLTTLPEGRSIAVAIKIKHRKTDYTSSFIGVKIFTPEYKDLGLSVKWATYNLGATKPEENGGYYHWAGLQDITDTGYESILSTPYHFGTSTFEGYYKYIPSDMFSYWAGAGSPDNLISLQPDDDIAHVSYGEKWRMPTYAEWMELIDQNNCISEWTMLNGINGFKIQSKIEGFTDQWIFLPASGRRILDFISGVGSHGAYCSSNLNVDDPYLAHGIYFTSKGIGEILDGYRTAGFTVRPVHD